MGFSLLTGFGLLETVRSNRTQAETPALFRLEDHLARLYRAADALLLPIPFSRPTLRDAVRETLRRNGIGDGLIRVLVGLDGGEERGLDQRGRPVMVAVEARPVPALETAGRQGLRARISSHLRPAAGVCLPQSAICGNRVRGVLAKREALEDGYDEALFLDERGLVCDGTAGNLFIVENRVLTTPPAESTFPGITRETVIELARWQGIHVQERPVTRDALYAADEAFLTGTAGGLVPLSQVDHRGLGAVPPGEITEKILVALVAAATGREHTFREWLTPV
jgi:branched-chain amino acid aminotransferase